MSTKPRLTLDAVMRQSREYRLITITPAPPTLFERVRVTVAYVAVAAGIGYAVFVVTPANAAGSMAQDVRVVSVSPSIVVIGTKEERKMKADIARDNNKALNNMELENQRSINRRYEAADKAYYEKLKDQRKHK